MSEPTTQPMHGVRRAQGFRGPREACGVWASWGLRRPAHAAFRGLLAQQHRGQESAGIVTTEGVAFDRVVGMGLVSEVFNEDLLDRLDGHAHRAKLSKCGCLGHNRYSTFGPSDLTNAQPLIGALPDGQPIALAHNGNLTNAVALRRELESEGHRFLTGSDTEVVLHLIRRAASRGERDPLARAVAELRGAFSLVVLLTDRVEAVRDVNGWRPLVIGRGTEGGLIAASETVALDAIGAEELFEVLPGEIVSLGPEGVSHRRFAEPSLSHAHCIFEQVYFASPASRLMGQSVQHVRIQLGEQLAIEAPVDAEIVLPMPETGRASARGYSQRSGIPIREAIIHNPAPGRSFIQPESARREYVADLKHHVVREAVQNARCVVIDDSIVRGTTIRSITAKLRQAGAREIHIRIASPAIRHPCHFGIDFPDQSELIDATVERGRLADVLGVDSVEFLSLDGLLASVRSDAASVHDFCTACFSGQYPQGYGRDGESTQLRANITLGGLPVQSSVST